MSVKARFIGGSLDGTERDIAGARDYVVPIQVPVLVADSFPAADSASLLTETYRRTRTVRIGGRLSHVEMTLLEGT